MAQKSPVQLFNGAKGHLLWILLMSAGVAINFFPLPILNAKFIFGSVFAMLILQLFGLGRGALAGAVIASVTFFQWNHPWALVTMSAEVVVAGWLIRRRPLNLVTAVSLYWLVIGLPLGFFCYSVFGNYSAGTTFFLLSKQAFNGVFNALVANLGIVLLALFLPGRIRVSFQGLLSNLLLFFTLATAMLLLVAGGRNDLADADRQLRSLLIQENRYLNWKLADWLGERKHQLSHLGESAVSQIEKDPARPFEYFLATDSGFLEVSLLDWEGNMPGFSLSTQRALKDIMTPSVLAAFRDRPEVNVWTHAINRNGREAPLVLMLSPLLSGGNEQGVLAGILDLESLRKNLKGSFSDFAPVFSLVNEANKVLLSNRDDLGLFSPFSFPAGKFKTLDNGMSQWIPNLPPNTSNIELWGKSRYVIEQSLDNSDWRLWLELPVAPSQKLLYERYGKLLILGFLVGFLAMAVSEFLSRRVLSIYKNLGRITHDLPARLAVGEKISWPESIVEETQTLTGNFRGMAEALAEKFTEIRKIHGELESKVHERTEALRKNEALLNSAMEMARMGPWEYDKTEDLFTFNDRFYGIFGVTAEEVGGYQMSSAEYALRFVHPADRHIVAEEIRKHLESDDFGVRRYLEHRIVKADGTVGHIAVHYSIVKDSEGTITGSYGGNQDITERKNTEKDLRRSQARLTCVIEEQRKVESELRHVNELLTNLAEQVPGAIYQYQLFPDGRSCFPYASPGLTEIYELAPEEVRYDATPFLERLHPEDREAALAAVDESARTLGLFQCEFRVILPRQGICWRACRSKPIPMEDGSILWHGMISDITDRKQAEEKLSHSKDLMSYIIEHDRSAIAVHDKDLNYIYVSRRYLEQYKVGEQDIIGRHHYEVFPDLPQKWREIHQKALQGEVSSAEEDPCLSEDGAIDWTRWECRPWYESDGSIGGIVVYTEVITERKKTEEALRLMASQYMSLLRTCTDGYCLFDKNGHLLEVNDAYCSMIGYPRQKLISCHVSDLDALESQEESVNHMNEVIEMGYARFETQHKSQAGANLDVEISVSYWQEGERFLCFVRDISQRKKFEQALLESEEKFRSFVENVNDIIFSLTKEGILSYVSPNWLFFMGEPGDDAVGKSLREYIHSDDVPLFCEYLSQINLQWDKKTSVEYRIRHRDDTWLWHTVNISALLSADGEDLGYLGVARDITEKKKMQDFMVQTEKVMSLGTMAAGMAHEINNPLSIISQGVQNVLRRTRDDLPGNHKAAQETGISLEPLQQYLERRNIYRSLEVVLDAVKRSSDIVSNMLQFSRRSDLFPVACDINQILEKSITLAATDYDLKKKYDFRNIRILKEFSLQAEIPCIYSELEQVFLNMLRNSAQSFEKIERYEPTIILRSWEDRERNSAFVEIEDNGSGIEDQNLKNIFDPFFTTKKVGEGTGLGLAVSHHIVVQRHQGHLTVASKAGEWTRFRIQLPLKRPV